MALADVWFDKLDTDKAGKLSQEQFVERISTVLPPPEGAGPPDGGPGGDEQRPGGPGGPGGGFGRFVGPAFSPPPTPIRMSGSLARSLKAPLRNGLPVGMRIRVAR